jgi:chromosome segregation ATPase
MAKASLTLIQPARTPERQRLADAIVERDRRAALVEAKRAEIKEVEERRWSIWSRRDELEGTVRRLEAGHNNEAARRDALLRGECLDSQEDVEAVRTQLAEVNAELVQSQKAEAELLNDIQLLETPCLMARLEVEEAIRGVMDADPVRAALIDELLRLQPRVTMLRRAANAAFGLSDPGAGYSPSSTNAAPCPWEAAKARLASDPDARLPMPDEVFAEPPPRSAA